MAKPTPREYHEIAMDIIRRSGVRKWEFRRLENCDGFARSWRKLIVCEYPDCISRVYVAAHECGHVALLHNRKRCIRRHRKEFEAEQYAICAIESYGLVVPPHFIIEGRRYVAGFIERESWAGNQAVIDPDSFEWAKKYISEEVRERIETCGLTADAHAEKDKMNKKMQELMSTHLNGMTSVRRKFLRRAGINAQNAEVVLS